MLDELARLARAQRIGWAPELGTPYVNTIDVDTQAPFPGDLAIEERLASLMRWNALAMVVRANHSYGEPGGHIASYASAADLFETGFNHFFPARSAGHGGDLVFFQPHSAPGVYAGALRGRRPAGAGTTVPHHHPPALQAAPCQRPGPSPGTNSPPDCLCPGSALANERVQTNAAGPVVLKLKTAWRDGTTHLVMSPLEFMQRLAALVPRPRLHLIRLVSA